MNTTKYDGFKGHTDYSKYIYMVVGFGVVFVI